ncbi:hypothetical protein OKHIL_28070 [Mycolicibacterium mageritense]
MSNVVRPAAFAEREEDLRRAEIYAGYKRESEERVARRVIELLKEEGLVVQLASTP